jgi:hypothetical protein
MKMGRGVLRGPIQYPLDLDRAPFARLAWCGNAFVIEEGSNLAESHRAFSLRLLAAGGLDVFASLQASIPFMA